MWNVSSFPPMASSWDVVTKVAWPGFLGQWILLFPWLTYFLEDLLWSADYPPWTILFFFSIYFSSFKDCTISGWELLVECSGETSAPHLGRVQSLASGGWTLLGSLELIDCPSGSGASHFWMAIPKLPWWWTVDPWQEWVWTYAFMYGDG